MLVTLSGLANSDSQPGRRAPSRRGVVPGLAALPPGLLLKKTPCLQKEVLARAPLVFAKKKTACKYSGK